MKRKRKGLRAFLTALVCTLCLIVLALAFCEVDAQSRRIGFGDDETLWKKIEENWQLPDFDLYDIINTDR